MFRSSVMMFEPKVLLGLITEKEIVFLLLSLITSRFVFTTFSDRLLARGKSYFKSIQYFCHRKKSRKKTRSSSFDTYQIGGDAGQHESNSISQDLQRNSLEGTNMLGL